MGAKITNRALASNVAKFCELLRQAGIKISLGEELDAARALTRIPLLDKKIFYYGLRTALVKDPDLFVRYDLLFRQFWSVDRLNAEGSEPELAQEMNDHKNENLDIDFSSMSFEQRKQRNFQKPKDIAIYSPLSRISRQRFNPCFPPERVGQTKRLLRRFKRRFATRPGRRIVSSKSGRIDLARSFRKSVSKGGRAILLEKSSRKITRSRIVVLADVSGSMHEKSDEIYLILYLLKNISTNSEIFVFSTEVVRLTNIFTFSNFRDTAERISKQVPIWGSGTKIGECLRKFLEKHGSLIDHDTTVVIVSDGWDLGETDILGAGMRALKSKSRRIIWLNPHVRTKGYEPSCIGMKTALPYVDILTSPDVFASKTLFEEYFGKATAPSIR